VRRLIPSGGLLCLSGGGLAEPITEPIYIKTNGAFSNVPFGYYADRISGSISKSDGTAGSFVLKAS
jgi:hypothetical protein